MRSFAQIELIQGSQTSNVYSKLKRLLPKQPLLIGRMVMTDGLSSVLSLIGGDIITARGTGTVDQNYYVRNGAIESAAPDLELNEIII